MLYSLPPLLTLICFAGLMVLVVLRRRWHRVNRLLFLIALLGVLMYVDILVLFNVDSEKIALLSSRLDHHVVVFTIPLYIHFFHTYLNVQKRRWVHATAYGFALMLTSLASTPFIIEKMQYHAYGYYGRGGRLYPLVAAGATVALGYSVFLLFQAMKATNSNVQREKLKYVLAGFGLMGLLNGLNVLPLLGYAMYPPGNFSFVPLFVFAVGIFKYDLLDTGMIMNKSILYSIMTALLICFYALIITLSNSLLARFAFSESIFFPIVLFLVVALIFGPIKAYIQRALDRCFNRHRIRFRKAVDAIGRRTVAVLKIERIIALIIYAAETKMDVGGCRFFIRMRSGPAFRCYSRERPGLTATSTVTSIRESALLRYAADTREPLVRSRLMERGGGAQVEAVLGEMNALGVEVALPLIFQDRLNGMIAMGERTSGDLYLSEDVRRLHTLALQVSLSIENAHAYRELQKLNHHLDDLVALRTRELQAALIAKEKTQEQLVRSESLAAIGQLVAGVAHELNNPLSVGISLIQSVLEAFEVASQEQMPHEEVVLDLGVVRNELLRAKAIVASLLGLSRQTQTYTESVNINNVVQDALRVLSGQFKQDALEIVTRLSPDVPRIQGNFANLGQVAVNIFKNAMQAAKTGAGEVRISTHFDRVHKNIILRCEDTGPGIAEAIRKDIFKPFFTTKAVGEGTGLGLYISHEIIRRHGGEIRFTSRPQDGACFDIELPV